MSKLLTLTSIEEIEVLVKPAESVSLEPALFMKSKGELVEISVPSLEYENSLGEFMLKKTLHEKHEEAFNLVVEELAESVEQLSYFELMTLKPEYTSKLKDLLK